MSALYFKSRGALVLKEAQNNATFSKSN